MIRRSWFQAAAVFALVATASLLSGCFTNEDPATPTNEGPCDYYPTYEELQQKYRYDYEIPPDHNRDPDSHIDEWVSLSVSTWAKHHSYKSDYDKVPDIFMDWHAVPSDPLLTVYEELLCGLYGRIQGFAEEHPNPTWVEEHPNPTWVEIALTTGFSTTVHETLSNQTEAALWSEYERQTGLTRDDLVEMDYVLFVHFAGHYYGPSHGRDHVTRPNAA